MWNHKGKLIIVLCLAVAGWWVWQTKFKSAGHDTEIVTEITPVRGTLKTTISSSGTVLPKNRLEIKPPVAGRIDELVVKEADRVKAGQTIAWMSSTERAALLDSASGQGHDTLNYWKQIYKAIPLISPIEGTVIVATTQAGQTVTSADPVIVLSDKLIVRAQVDETDIGKIQVGQKASLVLDAYPAQDIQAMVDHIYYESKTVNNVTMYEVDLIPTTIPDFFRSGMNATVNFVQMSKENIVMIPLSAVIKEKGDSFVMVKIGDTQPWEKRAVSLGITDEKSVEVVSGVTDKDTLIVKSKKFVLPKSDSAKNPFSPMGNRRPSGGGGR